MFSFDKSDRNKSQPKIAVLNTLESNVATGSDVDKGKCCNTKLML